MLSNSILAHLFVLKLLEVSLHDDLLLRLVEHLQTLVEEGGRMLLIRLLGRGYFHGWAVIADLASYIDNRFEYETTQTTTSN